MQHTLSYGVQRDVNVHLFFLYHCYFTNKSRADSVDVNTSDLGLRRALPEELNVVLDVGLICGHSGYFEYMR